MQVLVNDTIHSQQLLAYDRDAGFTIGQAPNNQVVLARSRFVSPLHVAVDFSADGWTATVDPSATAVEIDGKLVAPGESVRLHPVSNLRIAGYILTLRENTDMKGVSAETMLATNLNRVQREIHQKVISQINPSGESGVCTLTPNGETLLAIRNAIDNIVKNDYPRELGPNGNLRQPMLKLAFKEILRSQEGAKTESADDMPENKPQSNNAIESLMHVYCDLLRPIFENETEYDAKVTELCREIPENVQFNIMSLYLHMIICNLIFGLGPLQTLLDMPGVSEIMVVSPSLVYIEHNGKLVKSGCTFLGDAELMSVLERIVAPLGRRIDRSSPLVDARLADGSRVNAVIPPLALKGPCITIRRFPEERVTYNHLLKWGSLTEEALELLRGLVRGRKNIIVAGGTGSGKTTMLNVISGFIPEKERIVTIEDSAELQLQHEHLVSLETRPANVEGKGEVNTRDLIKNALRMRPDRIIVGECRGAETFDMLQAMNTGHNGSMTTVHANSPEDVITRLESMCLTAVDIPLLSLRQQISQAVNFVIYLARMENGQRLTTAIAEITGIDPRSGKIQVRTIMRAVFNPDTQKYHLENNGYIPSVLPELAAKNLIDLKKVYPS